MENEFLQLTIYNLTGGVRVPKIDFIRTVPESVGLSSENICGTVILEHMRKVRTVFCPDFLAQL